MKLTLPIYGNYICGNEVAVSIQLLGESETLVVKCAEHNQAWGDKGIYAAFGLIQLDTNDIKTEKSKVLSKESSCVDYKNIKFTPMTGEQIKAWFYKHYNFFNK